MSTEEYTLAIDQFNSNGEPETVCKDKYEFQHALNEARERMIIPWVVNWTITRKSDGVVLAQWGDL